MGIFAGIAAGASAAGASAVGMSAIEAISAISAISTVAGTVSSAVSQEASASAQEAAVNTQTLEKQYKIGKQKNIEMQNLHIQLARNEMLANQKGLSEESPTFNAIQANEFNNTAKSLQNGTVALKVNDLSEKARIASIHSGLNYGIVGTIFGAGEQLSNNYQLNNHIQNINGFWRKNYGL